jgi:hypothetical protein
MTNVTSTKPAYFTVQVKTKSLDELTKRYAHGAIGSLMEFGCWHACPERLGGRMGRKLGCNLAFP